MTRAVKPYNSRTHWSQTARQLVGGAALIIVLAALAFAALRLGEGALLAAIGALAVVALMVVMTWFALKVIEWLGGRE